MDNQLTQAISVEINVLIHNHIEELQYYLNYPITQEIHPSQAIIAIFSRLAEICDEPPHNTTFEHYLDAQSCVEKIRSFLAAFNQQIDTEFEVTKVGQLLVLGTHWYHEATKNYSVSMNYVWDVIAPVVPDHLEQLDYNTFEAQWWSPVPVMDVEILQRTEGITILADPVEPKNLPGGLSVQFRVSTDVGSED